MASEDEMLVMNDKELIDFAAKAAGIEWRKDWLAYLNQEGLKWNPLNDDGDALRLAVKLNLDIYQDPMDGISNRVDACANDYEAQNAEESGCMCWATEERGNDPYAATRRAIVRAAAEIGRSRE